MPVFLVVVAIVASTTALLPRYEPAGTEAYSLDLEIDGYVNGFMEAERMMSVNGCLLERDAAYTYSMMVEAAARDGVRLRHEDCYRTYHQQSRAYDRRCPVTAVPVYGTDPDSGERVEAGTQQMRVCSGPITAPAGESNHGWGRAIDFSNGRRVIGCYDTEFHWLKLNARHFGWVHPPWAHCGMRNQEPWHWEYGGVIDATLIPTSLLDRRLLAIVE